MTGMREDKFRKRIPQAEEARALLNDTSLIRCPYLASFRNRELIATITVLADISTAPAAGVSMMPKG